MVFVACQCVTPIFIMGKPKHEIHTLSRDRFSEHEGGGLTLFVMCVLQKTAPSWPDPTDASNHITAFIKSKREDEKLGIKRVAEIHVCAIHASA
jgi:hypothetical protein